MLIEVHGQENMLEQIRFRLQDQLQKRGYGTGPRISSVDRGMLIDLVKEGVIISIQLTRESESGDSILHVESEQEIPELKSAWDDALISYGKDVLTKIRSFASDKKKVSRGLR